jgi:NADPH:quinone reductase-like Zn-dependent oxidoreductase
MVGAPNDARLVGILARLIGALVLSLFVSQELVIFLAKSNREDLTTLGNLVATGRVTPVIDRRFSLSQVPEALRHLEEGHARGKVAIILEQHNKET